MEKTKKEKKNIFNNKCLFIIIGIALVIVLVIILLLAKTFANGQSNSVLNHSVDLECEEYTSFNHELKCTLSGVIDGSKPLSGVSVKLSQEPYLVEGKINASQHKGEVMNSGEYVDIIFEENVSNDGQYGYGERIWYADIYFENVNDDTNPIRIESADYYDSNYESHTIDSSYIYNNVEDIKTPSYNLDVMASGSYLIDSKYLLIQAESSALKSAIEDSLNGEGWNLEGCTYEISSDGRSILLTDNYNNTKEINVIYINEINNYTLPWHTTGNVYTRDSHTNDQIKEYCYDTNGYFELDEINHKIRLYADSERTKLLSEKNWYYIYSTIYQFSNDGSISLTGSIDYQDFINTIKYYGVTFEMVSCEDQECKKGNVINSGNLHRYNKLNISGVPGYDDDFISISTNEHAIITLNDLNYKYLGGAANSTFYVVYDIAESTSISTILEAFSISDNLTVKILNKSSEVLFNGNFADAVNAAGSIKAATDMCIVFTDGTLFYEYNISVLGDVTSDGNVNLSDVIKLYRMGKNKEANVTAAQEYAGDVVVDDDNTINTLDVAHLYRFFRGVDNTLKINNN